MIRTPEITALVRPIADSPECRAQLVRMQQEFGFKGGLVTEGRDQGSVVFPDAEHKFYLDASDDVRAHSGGPSALAVVHGQLAPIEGLEERIPLRGVRKKIAENMARSVHTAAHFTYVEEMDVTDLVALRDRARVRAEERGSAPTA